MDGAIGRHYRVHSWGGHEAAGGSGRVLVSLVVVAAACDWTTVGFDASRSGFNSLDKAITVENVGALCEWTAALATAAGSDPVVAGGKVFATSSPTGNVTTGAHQSYDARRLPTAPARHPRRVFPVVSLLSARRLPNHRGEPLRAHRDRSPGPRRRRDTPARRQLQRGLGLLGELRCTSLDHRAWRAPVDRGCGGRMYASVTDIVRPIPIQTAGISPCSTPRPGPSSSSLRIWTPLRMAHPDPERCPICDRRWNQAGGFRRRRIYELRNQPTAAMDGLGPLTKVLLPALVGDASESVVHATCGRQWLGLSDRLARQALRLPRGWLRYADLHGSVDRQCRRNVAFVAGRHRQQRLCWCRPMGASTRFPHRVAAPRPATLRGPGQRAAG